MAAVNQGWNKNCADFPAVLKKKESLKINKRTSEPLNMVKILFSCEKKKREIEKFSPVEGLKKNLNSPNSKRIRIKKKKSVPRLNNTAFLAPLTASSREENQLIKRKERIPTPSHPKKVLNIFFPPVNRSINKMKTSKEREKSFNSLRGM